MMPAAAPAPLVTPAHVSPRVLIVEDSFMTARRLARMIEDFGVTVLGPVPSVRMAMAILDAGGCDVALLDINLGSETVEAVAERLDALGLPFVFVSGYASPKTLLENPRYRSRRLVPKPVEPIVMREALRDALAGA